MTPRHRISSAAVELVKRFEGYRRTAARLPAGGWTVGYGHTVAAREGAEVSEADAEALLIWDLNRTAEAMDGVIFTPLTQNQFDALVCFAFNVGADAFAASAVLRRINEGDLLRAAWEIEMWRQADFEGERIVVDALVRRRSAEKALFLTPAEGYVPIPTPVVRPLLDQDAVSGAPGSEPVELTTALEGPSAVAARHAPEATDDAAQAEAQAAPADPHPEAASAGEAVAAGAVGLAATGLAVHAAAHEPAEEPATTAEQGVEDIDPFPSEATREAPLTLRPAPTAPTPAAPGDEAAPRWVDEPYPIAYPELPPYKGQARASALRRGLGLAADSYPALISLLVVGLAVFIAALAWILQPPAHPVAIAAAVTAWAVAVAGVLGVAAATYLLLEKHARERPRS